MSENSICLDGEENDVCYVYLPAHPGKGTAGCVAKSERIGDVLSRIGNKKELRRLGGADIVLDYNKNDILIGIEIIV